MTFDGGGEKQLCGEVRVAVEDNGGVLSEMEWKRRATSVCFR